MANQILSKLIRPEARSLSRGILFGLFPLLVFIVSDIVRYFEGYQCGNDLILGLQKISLVLWGIELLAGILCLFNVRFRFFATILVLTLLLSAPLSWPLEQLSLWLTSFGLPLFCHMRS
jgi:hypothetical protein